MGECSQTFSHQLQAGFVRIRNERGFRIDRDIKAKGTASDRSCGMADVDSPFLTEVDSLASLYIARACATAPSASFSDVLGIGFMGLMVAVCSEAMSLEIDLAGYLC